MILSKGRLFLPKNFIIFAACEQPVMKVEQRTLPIVLFNDMSQYSFGLSLFPPLNKVLIRL